MSGSLRPHGLQQPRLPCPSLSPRVCSNSCTLNQWCYPTISYSAALFSLCFQSFPASGSFPISQLLASGSQSIEASASTTVLPMNIEFVSFRIDWCHLLVVQETLKSLLHQHSSKASVLWRSAFFMVQLSHPYTWLLEKPQLWLYRPLSAKWCYMDDSVCVLAGTLYI